MGKGFVFFLQQKGNLDYLGQTRWEMYFRNTVVQVHRGGTEDMNIIMCDLSDNIHEKMCHRFEDHFTTLTFLSEGTYSKSSHILCTDTNFEHGCIQ